MHLNAFFDDESVAKSDNGDGDRDGDGDGGGDGDGDRFGIRMDMVVELWKAQLQLLLIQLIQGTGVVRCDAAAG